MSCVGFAGGTFINEVRRGVSIAIEDVFEDRRIRR